MPDGYLGAQKVSGRASGRIESVFSEVEYQGMCISRECGILYREV